MALLLDLANIVGGFLLAIALLRKLPRVGDDLGRFAARVAPFGWIVGVVALVAARPGSAPLYMSPAPAESNDNTLYLAVLGHNCWLRVFCVGGERFSQARQWPL